MRGTRIKKINVTIEKRFRGSDVSVEAASIGP
jgi:hypothetical protein